MCSDSGSHCWIHKRWAPAAAWLCSGRFPGFSRVNHWWSSRWVAGLSGLCRVLQHCCMLPRHLPTWLQICWVPIRVGMPGAQVTSGLQRRWLQAEMGHKEAVGQYQPAGRAAFFRQTLVVPLPSLSEGLLLLAKPAWGKSHNFSLYKSTTVERLGTITFDLA